MPRPDFLAMDISALQFNIETAANGMGVRPLFDAIVCDPPYGVRARSSKAGIRESKLQKEPKQNANLTGEEPYFSQKEHFDFVELHDHLLDIAATLLVSGGRLVFLFHTDEEESEQKNRFPTHP